MQKTSKSPKGFVTLGAIGLGVAFLASLPFSSSIILKWQADDEIYYTMETAPEREAALVLGAAAYGDKLSDILKDRVDTGIDLYKEGKVQRIIMSGAENETKAMRRYAVIQKVPAEAVTEDPQGLNTYASVSNLSGKESSLIIVTQEYHLPRALFLARHFDMDAVGLAADRSEYTKMLDFKKRELLATTKAVVDVLFLGK